ncbi:unnamed protein product, partial [Hapterophycus canaliculatus]
MVIASLTRSLFVVLLLAAYAVEAFVVTARPPASYSRRSFIQQRQQQRSTPKTSAAPPLTPARMSSQYEQGSSEPSAGGSLGGSSEMQLQELIVDFTDDGRILLEVKGVKGNECRVITEDLIKALGDVITTENTEEYFEDKVVNVQ